MTREEIIEAYEGAVFSSGLSAAAGNEEAAKDYELLKAGLTALRGPTREMVERMFPGCEMCSRWNRLKLSPCANGDLGVQADIGSAGKDDTFGLVVYRNLLASGYVDFLFCPFCGKPKTPEAVDMMLRRWKETLDNDN